MGHCWRVAHKTTAQAHISVHITACGSYNLSRWAVNSATELTPTVALPSVELASKQNGYHPTTADTYIQLIIGATLHIRMRKLLSLLCVAAAGMVLLCCCHADAQPLPCKRLTLEDLKGVKHVPDELLVQFKPGSNEQKIAKALAKGKAQKLERLRVDADGELHVVKLRGKGVADAIRVRRVVSAVVCYMLCCLLRTSMPT